MLQHTFIHMQGIGVKTERKLWRSGIRTWKDFLQQEGPIFSPGRDEFIKKELEASVENCKEIRFFSDRLTSGHMWRLYKAFKHKAVYLDIETSGDSQGLEEITVIGIYNGRRILSYVNGINLDDFEIEISNYDLIITFNGTCFDLPIIRRWFRGISLPPAHIALRFVLKKLGYTGGLKKIEKALGIGRSPEIDGMDGYEAVLLWKAYQWGDRNALNTLIDYNTADIVNLKPLMELGYKEMKKTVLAE